MKVSDIRPKKLIKKLEPILQSDRKKWHAGKKDFIRVACPACDSRKIKDPIVVRGMTFETCSDCETVFYNPRPTQDQLDDYYAKAESYVFWTEHIFPKTEKVRRENIFRPLVKKTISYLKDYNVKPDVLMEVGAGFGIFCDEMKKSKFFKKIIAVEPVSKLAQRCRDKELETIESSFETVNLPSESISCIVLFEVIEHLFSPKKLVQKSRYFLKKNGLLIFTCPNIKGFDFMVLGKKKAENFGLEHINMFHPDSIKILLKRNGFKVLNITTPGKLDTDIVRNSALKGKFNINKHPFLKRILIDEWNQLGDKFQQFLSANNLSSNMMIVAQRK